MPEFNMKIPLTPTCQQQRKTQWPRNQPVNKVAENHPSSSMLLFNICLSTCTFNWLKVGHQQTQQTNDNERILQFVAFSQNSLNSSVMNPQTCRF